jgi:hypothetical protein
MLSCLLQIYIEQLKKKYNDIIVSKSIEYMMYDFNYLLSTIKTFCDHLSENGYIIRKRDSSSNNNSSVESNDHLNNKTEAKRTKEIINCPHNDRKHYAKVCPSLIQNMCNNCYHKQGRSKRAWLCPHTQKSHYAKGKCQQCYLNEYHEVIKL